jgi:hypothetical protein
MAEKQVKTPLRKDADVRPPEPRPKNPPKPTPPKK